ncbi:phosphoribosylformylglycinamidine synthase subunit PurL [Limisalsivibrio acetivorans]|uniref:phosphoribosylformylglycinamidine synthase subunit PurL n=1 Tax=Limisalsivibrio acetivorans TaxID=1304888 RepID=UPI0003B6C07D|nr:phosphoribosylformylglycinamidine synthase subunit PurL [Limisalsivibrio acetivorans]
MSMYDTFKYPPVTAEAARGMGLKDDEFLRAKEILGREPNYIELGVFSAMWSEHCSYKSSRLHLAKLPTKADWVVQGPGENAGIIEVDGDICACFKVESHNHPSYIEPFQGAATGVGGIMRDVFTMGARPVAAMNSLRFGTIDNDKTRSIFEGVVSGISHYGNCFGVPTVGGEVFFNPSYRGNPLVNAFSLGIVKKDKIFLAKAEGEGNPVIYVGARTGKDGIHGATMASEEFSSESESKRPNVQIGDPFKEKLLLEACLELMKHDWVVGIQDMGAAGLTSSSFEMGAQSGVVLDLDKVPVREDGMTPYEIMLSESQERMLMVVRKGCEDKVREIFDKWDLEAAVIGRVAADGNVRLTWQGEEVACIPAAPLSSEAPKYDRPYARPDYMDELNAPVKVENTLSNKKILLKLLESPNIASKKWVWEQYDHMVRVNTAVLPGSDAAVLRVKDSGKGIAISSDCNSRYCRLDPFEGGKAAVAESARNVAVSGARPRALTNCLNFGNPEKPDIMWQFVGAVEGMAEAAGTLETPVVSGNVSLYNETEGQAVYPTPTIVMVGVIDDLEKRLQSRFKSDDSHIYLLGTNTGDIGGSEYLSVIHGVEKGMPPKVDLEHEKKLIDFMVEAAENELALSAHDVSDGGIAVALAEMAFGEEVRGFRVDLEEDLETADLLFGENHGRVIVEVSGMKTEAFERLAQKHNLSIKSIGKTGGNHIVIKHSGRTVVKTETAEAREIHAETIGRWMSE